MKCWSVFCMTKLVNLLSFFWPINYQTNKIIFKNYFFITKAMIQQVRRFFLKLLRLKIEENSILSMNSQRWLSMAWNFYLLKQGRKWKWNRGHCGSRKEDFGLLSNEYPSKKMNPDTKYLPETQMTWNKELLRNLRIWIWAQ